MAAKKSTPKIPARRQATGRRPGILPAGNTDGYTRYEARAPQLDVPSEPEPAQPDPPPPEDERERFMSLGEHLEELRRRLLWILAVLVVASGTAGGFIEKIHSFLVQPYLRIAPGVAGIPGANRLLLGSVYGALEIYFKLSMMVGMIVTLPIALSLLWGFVTPAVSRRTARIGHGAVAASTLLFWLGVAFAWLVLFPMSLDMMLNTFLPEGVVAQTSLEKYYSFLFMIVLGSGLTFQLPMVVVMLGAIGIVTTAWHAKVWRYVIIAILLFAGFITPPDPFSIFALAIPLIVLYIVSVGLVWLLERARRRRSAATT